MKEIDFSQLPSELYDDVCDSVATYFEETESNMDSINLLPRTGLVIFNNINSRTMHEYGRIEYIISHSVRQSFKQNHESYDKDLSEYLSMIKERDTNKNHNS